MVFLSESPPFSALGDGWIGWTSRTRETERATETTHLETWSSSAVQRATHTFEALFHLRGGGKKKHRNNPKEWPGRLCFSCCGSRRGWGTRRARTRSATACTRARRRPTARRRTERGRPADTGTRTATRTELQRVHGVARLDRISPSDLATLAAARTRAFTNFIWTFVCLRHER